MRALLLDAGTEEILLIKALVPDTGVKLWFTQGGGREDNEPDLQCLAREVHEETGLAELPEAFEVWTRSEQFVFMGQHYHQDELYFLVPVERFDVAQQHLEAHERDTFLEARWWRLDDIGQADEVFVPADIGALLKELLEQYRQGNLPRELKHVGR